jgi:hypothetical protein
MQSSCDNTCVVCAHNTCVRAHNTCVCARTHTPSRAQTLYTHGNTDTQTHTTQGDASTASGARQERQEIDIEGMSRDVSAVAAHLQVCVCVCARERERQRETESDGCVFAHDAGGVCLRTRGRGGYANTNIHMRTRAQQENHRLQQQWLTAKRELRLLRHATNQV